ncbi:MAG: hypothetical protein IJH90_02685, partial [Mogibacterium sp.]|nr:hypothetical protein [Mogibacterium sp.]
EEVLQMKHRLITITAVMIVSFALLSCKVYASDSSFLSPEDGQIISAGEVLHISFVTVLDKSEWL